MQTVPARHIRIPRQAVLTAALVLGSVRVWAATPTPDQLQFFESKIRPVLVNNCYKCHSSQIDKLKGGLSVEFRDTLLKGGDKGPAIVPGDPDHSLLIKAIGYSDPDLQMPPKAPLSDQEIADLSTWIKMGAPDPRVAGAKTMADYGKGRLDHWSFLPVKKVAIPAVKNTNWVSTPIDAFILAKLEANDMKPSPAADRRTLLRRATYDLTGLPPTPEESEAFVNDPSPDAFAKVVDRLLDSPQYGERWGRFWLDTARYSDTKGDIKQQQEAALFPFAWTYRDYVIKSFNDDKPYNKFLVEQIAGDHIAQTPNRPELAALGFLTLGPRFNENINDIDNDRIDVVCKGTMGLTVTCARCHDHKFDPIPQVDYYALKGIFDSSAEPAEEPILGKLEITPAYTSYEERRSATNRLVAEAQERLKLVNRGTNNAEKQELRRIINTGTRIVAQLDASDPGSPPRATAMGDILRPHNDPLFIRGEAGNKGPIVQRHFLQLIAGTNPIPFTTGSGRLQLANSIVDPRNPLTARVMVNRIWLHHFGEGFVTTPDDFGNQSDPPSHPELLDYLAGEFVRNGWSIKKMHRLIMLSSVYQESSENNPRYAEMDPQNRLLWRANIHRLEFEAVRDTILFLGDQLDLTMGGPAVLLNQETPGVQGGYSHRRTVYGMVDRRNLPEIYSQFDFANPDITMGKRYETTVPQQALFMMNNPLVIELARKLVNLPEFTSLPGEDAKIRFLYERILQRLPTQEELQLGKEFINEAPPPELITAESRQHQQAVRGGGGRAGIRSMSLVNMGPGQLRAIGTWVKYAHALLQTNEAVFLN